MTPPTNIEIVQLLYAEMAGWHKKQMTDDYAQKCMTDLADRLINYFGLHYTVQEGKRAMDTAAVLPGLPGGHTL